MWKIFWHKERNSKFIFVLYLIILVVYSMLVILQDKDISEFSSIFILSWSALMTEIFKHSLFNLSYYYSNGSDYSVFKPVASYLKAFLQLLSIKTSDFILYNIIYTIIKLTPFVLVTLIFATTSNMIFFILFFVLFFVVKAYMGPMQTILNSIRIEIYSQNKDLTKQERKEEFEMRLKSVYPNINVSLYNTLFNFFQWGCIIVLIDFYVAFFQDLFPNFSFDTPIIIGIFICGHIVLMIYGVYINKIENEFDHELYQK